jgi:hypothetical protein
MATEKLLEEVDELKKAGYKVELEESEGVVNLIFENYSIPPLYNKTSTTLLLRLPISYPNGNPDMFWTDVDLETRNGKIPTKAESVEIHLSKQWRRFSWHPQGWNPGTGNLCMYLEFVNRGFLKAGSQ